jgi:hypothetical protein
MLLRDSPPPGWISSILLGSDGLQSAYFACLVTGTAITALILFQTLRLPRRPGALAALATPLFVFLVTVEVLLLPVNYGILVASGSLPRVAQIENQPKGGSADTAWLVWDSKEALTYIVCENNSRSIVSIPKKDNRVSIVAYEPIFQVISRPPCSSAAAGNAK